MKRKEGVRVATKGDAAAIGALLYRFNREFNDPTPPPNALARRMVKLMASGETVVLLAGDGPSGIAVLRFRSAIWSTGLESYLAELYVVPEHRRQGLGRALMQKGIALARSKGADSMDLNTDEGDHAAHALYESLGFSSRAGSGQQRSYYYELEL